MKDLGQIAGIIFGTTAPMNTKIWWFDENDNLLKYYNHFLGNWESPASNNLGLIKVDESDVLQYLENKVDNDTIGIDQNGKLYIISNGISQDDIDKWDSKNRVYFVEDATLLSDLTDSNYGDYALISKGTTNGVVVPGKREGWIKDEITQSWLQIFDQNWNLAITDVTAEIDNSREISNFGTPDGTLSSDQMGEYVVDVVTTSFLPSFSINMDKYCDTIRINSIDNGNSLIPLLGNILYNTQNIKQGKTISILNKSGSSTPINLSLLGISMNVYNNQKVDLLKGSGTTWLLKDIYELTSPTESLLKTLLNEDASGFYILSGFVDNNTTGFSTGSFYLKGLVYFTTQTTPYNKYLIPYAGVDTYTIENSHKRKFSSLFATSTSESSSTTSPQVTKANIDSYRLNLVTLFTKVNTHQTNINSLTLSVDDHEDRLSGVESNNIDNIKIKKQDLGEWDMGTDRAISVEIIGLEDVNIENVLGFKVFIRVDVAVADTVYNITLTGANRPLLELTPTGPDSAFFASGTGCWISIGSSNIDGTGVTLDIVRETVTDFWGDGSFSGSGNRGYALIYYI